MLLQQAAAVRELAILTVFPQSVIILTSEVLAHYKINATSNAPSKLRACAIAHWSHVLCAQELCSA